MKLSMIIIVTLTMMMIKKHLFRQSKINYTVLKDSPYMEYFKVARGFFYTPYSLDVHDPDPNKS